MVHIMHRLLLRSGISSSIDLLRSVEQVKGVIFVPFDIFIFILQSRIPEASVHFQKTAHLALCLLPRLQRPAKTDALFWMIHESFGFFWCQN